MRVPEFFKTNAGKGMAAALLAVAICLVPLLAGWLVAAGALAVAYRQFRLAFRDLDREPAHSLRRADPPAIAAPARGEACDVAAVMEAARLAASPSKN